MDLRSPSPAFSISDSSSSTFPRVSQSDGSRRELASTPVHDSEKARLYISQRCSEPGYLRFRRYLATLWMWRVQRPWKRILLSFGLSSGDYIKRVDLEDIEAGHFRTVLKFATKYLWEAQTRPGARLAIIGTIAFMIGSNLASVCVPLFFQKVVDSLTINVAKSGSRATVANAVTATAVPFAMISSYFAAKTIQHLFKEVRHTLFALVTYPAQRHIARDAFAHLHNLDTRWHLNRQTGGLSRTLDRGMKAITSLVDSFVFTAMPALFEVVLICGVLVVKFGVSFAATTLFWLALYTWWTLLITEWRVHVREALNNIDEEVNSRAIDSMLNYEAVKYFNNEDLEVAKYDKVLFSMQRVSIVSVRSLAVLCFGQHFIVAAAMSSVMFLSCQGVVSGAMTLGDVVAVNGLVTQLFLPLEWMGWAYREIKQSLIDLRSLLRVMRLKPAITDSPDAKSLKVNGGEIEFRNVSFGYDKDSLVLKNVSFKVPPGKTVAIVGHTGSGKSTVLRLLLRFYDTSSGSVLIDGQDVSHVSQSSLRTAVGVVPQDTALFNDTIAWNIEYGRPGSSFEEVQLAAERARLHKQIQRMPNGFQTVVGERGAKLSGGERQRVCIARTFLKNPPLLIMDEATSALDTKTERSIVASLKELAEHRTCIIVAHRLSTVMDADEIIVMEKGEIKERGTHAELVALEGGRYASMWKQQLLSSTIRRKVVA